ncbi:hypothetical protein [Baaleninema sp.]|uniref:hypothetical protein n=1 Tax=Baaleninema sp. TaxID=3101197 RepID=UPI003CFF1484
MKPFLYFKTKFAKLTKQLNYGLSILIYQLVDKSPQIIDKAISLLNSKYGLWSQIYFHSFSLELEKNFSQMRSSLVDSSTLYLETTKYPNLQKLFNHISGFWLEKDSQKWDIRYKPLAVLFEKLENHKLAAVFYQIAEGDVPKSVFDKVASSYPIAEVFGLTVICQKSVDFSGIQKFFPNFKSWQNTEFFVFMAVIFVILAAEPLYQWVSRVDFRRVEEPGISGSIAEFIDSPSSQNVSQLVMSPREFEEASRNFNETASEIYKLREQLYLENENTNSWGDKNFSEVFLEAFANSLNLNPNRDSYSKNQVIFAIYRYQKENGFTADGIVLSGSETQEKLERDIRHSILESVESHHDPPNL